MTSRLHKLTAALAATAFLLAACGGGGGGGGGGSASATPPIAVARADQSTAAIGSTITLDASSSTTTAAGSTLSYLWTLASRPEGSAATLSSATAVRPTFVMDLPGIYIADLMVNDGRADSSHARFTVTATSEVPVAVIGAVPGVLLGSSVTLDGSTSLPPTGGAAGDLRYEWTLLEQPSGDPRTSLRNTTAAKAGFTADKVGIYRAGLVVRHGSKVSVRREVQVAVNSANSAPVIQASIATTAVRGSVVVLDASGSRDTDGDTLSYRWSIPEALANSAQVRPRGSTAAVRNGHTARAEFTPDFAGRYNLELTVYDGSVATTQSFAIDVTKPAGAANAAPVAVIGNDNAYEYELGGFATPSGQPSYDLDGDALTYRWTWWDTATPGTRNASTGASLNLGRNLPAGNYVAELVVNDGQVDSAPASKPFTIRTGANIAPAAVVKVDVAKVLVGQTIVFDGSGSSDRNGDPMTYQWTLVDRPDGSTATLQNATSVQASVTADRPGVYSARLQVRDPRGFRSYPTTGNLGSAFAKARNNPPVVARLLLQGDGTADLSPNQPLALFADGPFAGSASIGVRIQTIDPDQDAPLYYLLTPTVQPAGSTLTGTSDTIASGAEYQFGYSTSVPGDYEFQLVASDGVGNSEPKAARISVVDRSQYPGLLAETGYGWDATAGSAADFQAYQQRFWPLHNALPGQGLDGAYGELPRTVDRMRIYAGDRDYTVTDLVATSADSNVRPYFMGLQNGQVIRRGESAVFLLVRPVIPNEAAEVRRSESFDPNAPNYEQLLKDEEARLAALYASYRFTWSFRMPEGAGYSFYVGPAD